MAVQSKTIKKREKKVAAEAKEQAIQTAGKELAAERASKTPTEKATETIAKRQKLRAEAPDPSGAGLTKVSQTPAGPAEIAELRRQEANRQAGRGSFSDTAADLQELQRILQQNRSDPEAIRITKEILGGEFGEPVISGQTPREEEGGQGVLGGDIATPRNLALAAGAGLAIGGAVVGVPAIAGFLGRFGARTIATGGLSSPAVARAASGRITQAALKSVRDIRASTPNTFTARKAISYIANLVRGSKYSKILTGVAIGSIPFLATQTFNDRGDAAQTLAIQARDANPEELAESEELLSEMEEMNEHLLSINTLNYPKSVQLKTQAALKTVRSFQRKTEKNIEKARE